MKFFEFIIAHFPFLSNVIETAKNIFDIKKTFYETKTQKKKGDGNIVIVVFENMNFPSTKHNNKSLYYFY